MKTNEWAKTILTVYKYLETVSDSIDKLVTQNALNSFYTRGEKQAENGVMAVADRIIELSERKTHLINLKVLADKALLGIDRQCAQILIEKYMDNDESEEIALRHGLNVRTYFRRLYQAEVNFSQAMARAGFNDEKLSKYLEKEAWIIEVYQKYKEDKMENSCNFNLKRAAKNKLNKISVCKRKEEENKLKKEEDFDDMLMYG